MASVALCTPYGRPVERPVSRAIAVMQNANLDHNYVSVEVDSMIVGKARHMLVDTAMPVNPDVLLWVDDDVIMPPHAHILIDKALERGVVGGIYVARGTPYTPQIFELATQEEYKGKNAYWPLIEWPEHELFKVDAIGFGCVAIRADIFPLMHDFHTDRFKRAADTLLNANEEFAAIAEIVENLSPWFEFLNRKGEDLYFAERAREAGIQIWADPTVLCEHYGAVGLRIEHFTYLRDTGKVYRNENGTLMVNNQMDVPDEMKEAMK